MSELPKGPEWTEWLYKVAEQTLILEQIWQMYHSGKPVVASNEITLLVNEQKVNIQVDVHPLKVASLHEVTELPFEVSEEFYEIIKKLLADVDQAIRLLGGKPESKTWNQRDVLGILAEAKAYQTISAELGKLSRRTKQKVFYHLKGDLGKAKAGRPPALTEEEKTSLLAEYDRSRLTQAEFVDLKGISRSRLNRLLRERSATR